MDVAMKHNIPLEKLAGVWSAAPTPFDEEMRLDVESVRRMVEHHRRLGVDGLFLSGTSGEGPWITDGQRSELVKCVVESIKAAGGNMLVAVQVTDNSSARILDNMARAQADGAQIAVIAQPYFLMNATPDRIRDLYLDAIQNSPLPVGFYDRGKAAPVPVPEEVLPAIYAEENVIMAKDSSGDPERMRLALKAREKCPELRLLTGNEFRVVDYIEAGYDGGLLGGGVFNGLMARKIIEAVRRGDSDAARKLQQKMNALMFAVYGGEKIECWLSGLKKLLVEMGIFSTWRNYLGYPLTESCVREIRAAMEEFEEYLMPRMEEVHA